MDTLCIESARHERISLFRHSMTWNDGSHLKMLGGICFAEKKRGAQR